MVVAGQGAFVVSCCFQVLTTPMGWQPQAGRALAADLMNRRAQEITQQILPFFLSIHSPTARHTSSNRLTRSKVFLRTIKARRLHNDARYHALQPISLSDKRLVTKIAP